MITITIIIMKKMMVVISDRAYEILKRYKKAKGIANLDTALDSLLLEREQYNEAGGRD
ncbi:unnamed protein product [marine sediment metagenome]|uniref:Ribbon-helix-helix protein CopG domain-containing protein n=1 Tax=marine sediment metagenome TaxID=412755 RepID=X1E9X6_9ZZZZ